MATVSDSARWAGVSRRSFATVLGGADITVSNNTAIPDDTSGFPLSGIFVQSNAVTVPNTIRADIFGNTVPAGSTFDIGGAYLNLVGSNGAGCQLVGAAASVTAQLTATNTGSASGSGYLHAVRRTDHYPRHDHHVHTLFD